MAKLSPEIITFAKGTKKNKRVISEIMEKFDIPHKSRETLRKRLKSEGISLRENRGRKEVVI